MPDEPQQDNPVPPVNSQPSTPNPWEVPAPETPSAPVIGFGSESTPAAEPVATSNPPAVDSAVTPEDISTSIASEIEDTATVAPAKPVSMVTQQPKKSKKPLIVGLVIVLVLAVLGGASAFAYTMYESPQKVITDALGGIINAKTATYAGTVTIASSDVNASVALTVNQAAPAGSLDAVITLTSGGTTYHLTGDGLISSTGDLYVKLSNLGDLSTAAKSLLGAASGPTIDSLASKIDGTWIKISSSDLKSYSDTVATQESCVTSTIDKFKGDTSATNELTTLYSQHPFIVVDKSLGIVNGNIGYQIKEDNTAAQAFAQGLKSTKIYSALVACDSSFTIDSTSVDSTNSSGSGSLQIWVSQWSHQLAKTVFSSTSDGTTLSGTINTTFGKPVTVNAPATSTTLSDLESDIANVLQSADLQ